MWGIVGEAHTIVDSRGDLEKCGPAPMMEYSSVKGTSTISMEKHSVKSPKDYVGDCNQRSPMMEDGPLKSMSADSIKKHNEGFLSHTRRKELILLAMTTVEDLYDQVHQDEWSFFPRNINLLIEK